MGDWTPTADWFASLLVAGADGRRPSRPYPFFLAAPLERSRSRRSGARDDWQVEWKWDGIRAQLVQRAGAVHLWSRGEELITHRFPEIAAAATRCRTAPCSTARSSRSATTGRCRSPPCSSASAGRSRSPQMARAVPVVFMAYDLLEHGGRDVRAGRSTSAGSALESHLLASAGRRAAHVVGRDACRTWDDARARCAPSRARAASKGFMLKRLASPYGVGRKRGDWWKWKIDPYTIDAVLIYAQPGSGRRASLLTDYTFGVWDGGELVPVAKAYSGLSNEEIAELDRWIRRHTRERFGPVRHVEPVQVFELGFEGDRALVAPQVRHRGALPADAALAQGQAGGRSRHAGDA